MSTALKTEKDLKNPLRPQLRTSVRKAMVQQMARRLDEDDIRETSIRTLSSLTEEDKPLRSLMEALYDTHSVPTLSNKAAGKLVADVDKNRRKRAERVPVRSEKDEAA